MSLSTVTYALSKKYTDETAIGFGAVKGAACTIKSIEHQNGQNIVTFEWKNSEGETRESVMVVNDGTPIYEWIAGSHYSYGDLAIYQSCFYRCIQENSDTVFDDRKWNEIGSADGNYDIVQNQSMLPQRFTEADRKMYYCIEEELFYLWDGSEWTRQNKLIQFDEMPTPAAVWVNVLAQYIGETNANYTFGYFYRCEYIDSQLVWKNIDTQYSAPVAKTGNYNDLINRPATYLNGNNETIVLNNLDDGFYSVIGSYKIYDEGTTYIATSKKYFIIESSSEVTYFTEIRGNKIKNYSYSAEEGLTEDSYTSNGDVENILDSEFDTRAETYINNNIATEQQIMDLFI